MSTELLLNVSHDDYHRDQLPGSPRLSRSMAVKLLQGSPLHAWAAHPKLGGQQVEDGDPERLDRGSLLHLLLLGKGQQVATVEANDWRTNAAKAAREEARAAGLLPVLRGKYESAVVTADHIRRRLESYGVALGAFETEVTGLWEEDGVACKMRTDALSLAQGMILDPKMVERINLRSFEASIVPLGLHIQAAVYPHVIELAKPALSGRVNLQFLLCETTPPHDVALVSLAPAYVDLGRQQWARARSSWKRCLETGLWPGFGIQQPIQPKPWLIDAELAEYAARSEDAFNNIAPEGAER